MTNSWNVEQMVAGLARGCVAAVSLEQDSSQAGRMAETAAR